jgi:hypothetical protein
MGWWWREGRGGRSGERRIGDWRHRAQRDPLRLACTPSVSFYLSMDNVKLHYPATNKKKRREYCIVTQQRSPWKSQMSTTQITLPRMGHVKCKWARKGPTPNQPFRSFHGLGSKRRHNCRALFVGQETRQPPAQYCAELCEHDSLTTWQLVELYVLALWSARPNHGVVSSP